MIEIIKEKKQQKKESKISKIEFLEKEGKKEIKIKVIYNKPNYSISIELRVDEAVDKEVIKEATNNALSNLNNDLESFLSFLEEKIKNFEKLNLDTGLQKQEINIVELLRGYKSIMEESLKAESFLNEQSKKNIEEFLKNIEEEEVIKIETEDKVEDKVKDKVKIEKMIKILEKFKMIADEKFNEETIKELIGKFYEEKLSYKSNLKSIIELLTENKPKEALSKLIVTISNSFRENDLILEDVNFFRNYIHPLVASVADFIIRKLSSSREILDRWANVLKD